MEAISVTMQEAVLRAFGNRLRDVRKSRQLRQLDVESRGLNYKYYQRLESGQVNPTLKTLQKLAEAFAVSVYELFRIETPYDGKYRRWVCRMGRQLVAVTWPRPGRFRPGAP